MVKLSFEDRGHGDAIVLLHGFPFDRSIWRFIHPQLEQEARIISPDLRGHGKSPLVLEPYSIADIADDVVQLLNRLDITRAVIAGHSMGGYVALEFARNYPDRMAGLALIASHTYPDAPEKRVTRFEQAERVLTEPLLKVFSEMPTILTNVPWVEEEVRQAILRSSPQGISGALRAMAERFDTLSILSSMTVPAVIIAGLQDKLISQERFRCMSHAMPKPWLVEIQNCGHLPMLEQPKATSDALRALLYAVRSERDN